jgi:hypothetical protein
VTSVRRTAPAGTRERAVRRGMGVLAAVLVLGFGLAPLSAVADDEDPRPTEWPTVKAPTEGGADQSDPRPTALPTVKQPGAVGDEDPKPPEWPAPDQN